MPKIQLMVDGVVTKEVPLLKARTTLGRRPYNDVVLDNLAVSGEHAALNLANGQVYLEDLGSTNGSLVNGKAIKKQLLANGDMVELGKVQFRFEDDAPVVVIRGAIKVLSGTAAGREMPLVKDVTTLGKAGVSVAAITRGQHNFMIHHVDGVEALTVNGVPVGTTPTVLRDGDELVLSGTRMQFVQY